MNPAEQLCLACGLCCDGTLFDHVRLGPSDDAKKLAEVRSKAHDNLALDHSGALVYLAPTRVNLPLTMERWPDIAFRETREHLSSAGA